MDYEIKHKMKNKLKNAGKVILWIVVLFILLHIIFKAHSFIDSTLTPSEESLQKTTNLNLKIGESFVYGYPDGTNETYTAIDKRDFDGKSVFILNHSLTKEQKEEQKNYLFIEEESGKSIYCSAIIGSPEICLSDEAIPRLTNYNGNWKEWNDNNYGKLKDGILSTPSSFDEDVLESLKPVESWMLSLKDGLGWRRDLHFYPIFSDKESSTFLSKGYDWEVNGRVHYKVMGIENINGIRCFKVEQNIDLVDKEYPMHGEDLLIPFNTGNWDELHMKRYLWVDAERRILIKVENINVDIKAKYYSPTPNRDIGKQPLYLESAKETLGGPILLNTKEFELENKP